jgi:hypothetical protein
VQSKFVLVLANRQCAGLVVPLHDDLQSAVLVSPIAGTGNHTHWLLGHLEFSEGRYRKMMQGIVNSCQALQDKFGGGSQPDPKANGYPSYEELLSRLRSMDEEFMALLESTSEEELDQAIAGVPPQFELYFGTWRHMFLMRAMHWMNHRGQLADCRRAAGRTPLLI